MMRYLHHYNHHVHGAIFTVAVINAYRYPADIFAWIFLALWVAILWEDRP